MFLFEALNKILKPKKVEPVKQIEDAPKPNGDNYKNNYSKPVSKFSDKPFNSNNYQNKSGNYKSNDFPKKKWEDRENGSQASQFIKTESKFKKDDSKAYICYINGYNQVTYILNKEKITAIIDGVDDFVQIHESDMKLKSVIKSYLFETLAKKNVFIEAVQSDPLIVKIFLDEQKNDLLLEEIKSIKQTTLVPKPVGQSFKFNN